LILLLYLRTFYVSSQAMKIDRAFIKDCARF
jgi:hypothetical protein